MTLDLGDWPSLWDLLPVRDLSPCALHDANQDAGNSELGREDLQTFAGATPIASAGVKKSSIMYMFCSKAPLLGHRPRYCYMPFLRLMPVRALIPERFFMPPIVPVLPARAMFAFLIIFDTGLDLSVLLRLNDAMPGFFARVALARTRLATSIGLTHVAGSDTILPLRGPDVHLNLRFIPDLVRPSMFLAASSMGSTSSNSSNIFINAIY